MPDSPANTPSATVPILIPFPAWDEWVAECIAGCAALDYEDIELWLLPDAPLTTEQQALAERLANGRPVCVLPTGRVNPAKKRNVALRASAHAWAALIDADAYPRPDWLRNAFREMKPEVGIVAGPNVTPPKDPVSRQLSGLVMRSLLGFGPAFIRHHPVPRHEPEEMPTCNMLLRRVDGLYFREEFSTAEDMMYCRDLRARGLRIVYAPDVVVFHHRRRFPRDLAIQFYHYGWDKGRLFARGHPSSRLPHAMPALLLAYAIALALVLSLTCAAPAWLLLPGLAYAMLVLMESIRGARHPLVALGGLLAFPLAHASYGWGFWRGIPSGWRERGSAKDA